MVKTTYTHTTITSSWNITIIAQVNQLIIDLDTHEIQPYISGDPIIYHIWDRYRIISKYVLFIIYIYIWYGIIHHVVGYKL